MNLTRQMIFREEITSESIRVRIKNLGIDPGGFKPKNAAVKSGING